MKVGDVPPRSRVAGEGNPPLRGSSPEPKSSDSSSFSHGRLLKGTVVSFAADGLTQLVVSGKTLTAESLVPLKVGQELWFEVVREGPQPLLALADKKDAVGHLLRLLSSSDSSRVLQPNAISTATNLSQALGLEGQTLPSSVESFLKTYAEGAVGAESDPGKLLKNLFALGLFDKNMHAAGGVSSLKQELLDLLQTHSQKGAPDSLSSMEDSKGLSHLLKLFEAFGQLNSQATSHDRQDFLLFPCFFSGETGRGEWLFRFNKEDGTDADSDKTYGLSFFLELSNLEELHLNVRIKGNALQGVFSVLNEGFGQHMTKNLGELSLSLEHLGFHPVHLSCQVAQSSNMQKLKEELGDLAGKGAFSLVDVTI